MPSAVDHQWTPRHSASDRGAASSAFVDETGLADHCGSSPDVVWIRVRDLGLSFVAEAGATTAPKPTGVPIAHRLGPGRPRLVKHPASRTPNRLKRSAPAPILALPLPVRSRRIFPAAFCVPNDCSSKAPITSSALFACLDGTAIAVTYLRPPMAEKNG